MTYPTRIHPSLQDLCVHELVIPEVSFHPFEKGQTHTNDPRDQANFWIRSSRTCVLEHSHVRIPANLCIVANNTSFLFCGIQTLYNSKNRIKILLRPHHLWRKPRLVLSDIPIFVSRPSSCQRGEHLSFIFQYAVIIQLLNRIQILLWPHHLWKKQRLTALILVRAGRHFCVSYNMIEYNYSEILLLLGTFSEQQIQRERFDKTWCDTLNILVGNEFFRKSCGTIEPFKYASYKTRKSHISVITTRSWFAWGHYWNVTLSGLIPCLLTFSIMHEAFSDYRNLFVSHSEAKERVKIAKNTYMVLSEISFSFVFQILTILQIRPMLSSTLGSTIVKMESWNT